MEMGLLPQNQVHSTLSIETQADKASNDGFDARTGIQQERIYKRKHRKLLIQWIATIILAGLIVAIVTVHQTKGVLTSQEKSTYNILSTILILVLGLSFFVYLASVRLWVSLIL